ncbi:DUF3157 family protein [Aeromonas bivalvium]|uniref:DUF3157 family protein n=1 Tax=Aeromonas bivalvium TaxID=440079 RepID=UPI0005A7D92A|nr:DUF3157 family protein [Aeromonas bivalvium]
MKALPLLLLLSLGPVLAQAAPLTQVTLADGRVVQLNDDFSWEYLLVKPASVASTAVGVQAQSAPRTVAAPVLTEQALANPALLSEAARDGVQVRLDRLETGDTYRLRFMVHNTGSRNVVGVRGHVSLFDRQGVQLSRQEARFWVAENRLPETYLRKGEDRPSLEVEMAKPAGQGERPLVRVEIEEVVFR